MAMSSSTAPLPPSTARHPGARPHPRLRPVRRAALPECWRVCPTIMVQARLAKQLMSQGDAQAVSVISNVHTSVFLEQARQVAITSAGDPGESIQVPGFCWIARDGILHRVHGRMNVVATFEPWR